MGADVQTLCAEPARARRTATAHPVQARVPSKRAASRNDLLGREADRVAARAVTGAVGGLLQRSCACGGVAGPDGECAACRAKRLELQRRGIEPSVDVAPPIVHDALRSPGLPLDPSTRSFFEGRVGVDLGGVRVHTDGTAAASARAVRALAYTVGSHVAFAADRYEPETDAGRRLLGHELAHVLQQRGLTPSAGPLALDADPQAEREAQRLARAAIARPAEATAPALQRQVAAEDGPALALAETATAGQPADETRPAGAHAESPLEAPVGEPLQAPPAAAPATPVACDPTRALTWADFTGTPSGSAAFGAKTVAPVVTVSAGGATTFQARFDSRRSWVRPRFADPTNPAATSCRSQVQACQRFFDRLPAGQTGTWSFTGDPDPNCAASIVPSATPSATSRAECDSVIGAECDRAAGLESQRLLRHEQLHFDIACQIARKANTALAAGSSLATVRSAVSAKAQPTQDQYDADSSHGCDATGQSTWETAVSGSLPSVTIP
jgi:hypothetical protein